MHAGKIIAVRNVNGALAETLNYLEIDGYREESRNGPVLVAPGPVLVSYAYPRERVLFSKVRDANPFFHFMESLWMLGGRNDVDWIQQFNSRMGEFSDDKTSLWGAYGWRWREFFGRDQLAELVDHLRELPHSRRAVLSMWSPNGDLWPYTEGKASIDGQGGLACRDVPCNTQAYLAIHNGKLHLTVCNRSNDAIWGAFGANAVHMSIMQEYVAMKLGVNVGAYYQFSNNMHVYLERFDETKRRKLILDLDDRYAGGLQPEVEPQPLLHPHEVSEAWDADLRHFLDDPENGVYYTSFFVGVVAPMYRSWMARKRGGDGMREARGIAASDWRTACVEWLYRRGAPL